jgi:Hemingway/CFA97
MWCAGTKKTNEVDIIREHVQHIIKLNAIKPRTDTHPPKSISHLKKKLKTETIKVEKNRSIQTENQILLKKMFKIDSRPGTTNKLNYSFSSKSLNINNRIESLSKITKENKELLNRLQTTKSCYDFKKLDKDHKFKKYLLLKVSENSRRVPRVSTAGLRFLDYSDIRISRPGTISGKTTGNSGFSRSKNKNNSNSFL